LLLISSIFAVSGSLLISCSDVDARLQLISVLPFFASSLTTSLLLFAPPLLKLLNRRTRQHPPGCELRLFMPVTQTDVAEMVRTIPDKQCLSDPLPTWLLKANVDLLAPFLRHLFNWSLEHGVVPFSMKAA